MFINIWPICLPKPGLITRKIYNEWGFCYRYILHKLYSDKNFVLIIEWGCTDFDSYTRNTLHEAKVSTERCLNKIYTLAYDGQTSDVSENMLQKTICTPSPDGEGPCNRDSGGPINWLNPSTKKWELCGIVSWGYVRWHGDGTANTKVRKYLHWIKDNTNLEVDTGPITWEVTWRGYANTYTS